VDASIPKSISTAIIFPKWKRVISSKARNLLHLAFEKISPHFVRRNDKILPLHQEHTRIALWPQIPALLDILHHLATQPGLLRVDHFNLLPGFFRGF